MLESGGLFLCQFSLCLWSRQLFSRLSTSEAFSLSFGVLYSKNMSFKQKIAQGRVCRHGDKPRARHICWWFCLMFTLGRMLFKINSLSLSLACNPIFVNLTYVRFHSTVLSSTLEELN